MPTHLIEATIGINNLSGDDELWSSNEVARFLGCSSRHVYNLRKEGLPHYRIGDMVRFSPGKVMAWLEARHSSVHRPDFDERAQQLADITATGDDDNVECAAADLFREFPPAP